MVAKYKETMFIRQSKEDFLSYAIFNESANQIKNYQFSSTSLLSSCKNCGQEPEMETIFTGKDRVESFCRSNFL